MTCIQAGLNELDDPNTQMSARRSYMICTLIWFKDQQVSKFSVQNSITARFCLCELFEQVVDDEVDDNGAKFCCLPIVSSIEFSKFGQNLIQSFNF